MSRKRVAITNLGCKVNAYEADAMSELLNEAGYELVSDEECADIYIVNTCTVTNIADRKSRQMLHRAKKLNPDALVAAVGCYVETHDEPVEGVDLYIGNNRKKDIVSILAQIEAGDTQERYQSDLKEYEPLQISETAEHTRAFLKVQDGCNQFCSYCAIPLARGRVRSRAIDDVVAEVGRLAEAGYREVVLTGIHLSSYEYGLAALIEAVHEVPGLARIRLGSLEPRIITREFVDTLSGLPKFCTHFHLSLQSGCDRTLKAMNRRYSAAEFEAACELIRSVWPMAALCTDVIVGFPGETEEDFRACYEFVDRIGFYETHVFKYSRRKGTRADRMPDQLTDAVKTERSNALLELNARHRKAYAEQFEGRSLEILIEEKGRGHSKEYLSCEWIREGVPAPEPGTIVTCVAGTDCRIL